MLNPINAKLEPDLSRFRSAQILELLWINEPLP
jgi:hypothetical protein